MRWRKIAIAGIGLLGGSLGLAVRRLQLAGRVTGYVRRPEAIAECIGLGIADEATCDVGAAVAGADLIILCTPLSQMLPLMECMLPAVAPGCLVTDVGSAKEAVVQVLSPLARGAGAHFIGSHPMAGAELTGMAAARADLFQGAVCALTPDAGTEAEPLARLGDFWSAVGARPLVLPAAMHDAFVARSSHLPHILAAALGNYVLSGSGEQALLCANGFRDTTRVASGSPEMWLDIARANRPHLLAALGEFSRELERFKQALEEERFDVIQQFLGQAKERRDQWCRERRASDRNSD